MQFKWKRVIIREYNATYIWMTWRGVDRDETFLFSHGSI
jgi:hypothetical protein